MAKLEISLTRDELDAFLAEQRIARVATVGAGGPHVVPLWFVWFDRAVFLNTTTGNRTVVNLDGDPRAAATVDDGSDYDTLRGVVLRGRALRAEGDPRLGDVQRRWSTKYLHGNPLPYELWKGRIWLRLDPDEVASWDFRKIPEAKARREAARAEGR